jgi:hypothetical protein
MNDMDLALKECDRSIRELGMACGCFSNVGGGGSRAQAAAEDGQARPAGLAAPDRAAVYVSLRETLLGWECQTSGDDDTASSWVFESSELR